MGLVHFIAGCIPGPVLWRGKIGFQKGDRENAIFKGEYTVHQCLKCGQPFIHRFYEKIQERRKMKRVRPDSIPVAA